MVKDIVWMEVSGRHWDVEFRNVFIKEEYPLSMKGVSCTVDSGTSLFYLPEKVFKKLGDLVVKDRKEC